MRLGRQRRRWSHGPAQLLWKHRRMIGDPRFGAVGTMALPFFLVLELLGHVVEILGLASVALAAAIGVLDLGIAVVMIGLAVAVGTLLSVTAIAVEVLTYRRYRRGRDLLGLVAAALVENIGYRQVHARFRPRGLVAALTRRSPVWTAMPRVGFAPAEPLEAGGPAASTA